MYTDSHAHLSSVAEELGEDALAGVLSAYARAWEAALPGIPAAASAPGPAGPAGARGRGRPAPLLVDIGTEPGDYAARRALLVRLSGGAALPPWLRMSLGVWPGREALAEPRAALVRLTDALAAAGAEAAAIGECGLDYHHMDGSRAAQAELFEGQIGLARERGLALVVHSREAFEDTRDILRAARLASPVLIHCFGYGRKEAEAFLELGAYLSFAGNLTYKKAEALREALAAAPADRLLLETDAPYMNPEPRRGRPSSPSDIARSYEAAVALRGEAPESLAASVAANARLLFG